MSGPGALVALCLLAPATAWAAPAPSAALAGFNRLAVLVGSNAAAPGRRALRYGHRDAERMAAALTRVGRFAPEAVHVLRDPSPDELLAVLGRQAATLAGRPDSLLYFYYSGHADEGALYPGGRALPMERLRQLLDQARVAVKVGMVDACRGGGWTRAKGLHAQAAFPVTVPLSLANEGSVLIAASSGYESAHESDYLEGSFFTSHFVAALLGAADRSGDGQVTLSEAFDYAKERTVRDSLRYAREAQHPSYATNLRGRQDLVLAHIAASGGGLEVAQQEGPLELLHAGTGAQLLELPPGLRRVRLAVPPGRYIVRKGAGPDAYRVKELAIDGGAEQRIDEADLVLVPSTRLRWKGDGNDDGFDPAIRNSLPGRRRVAIELTLGPQVGFYEWWADNTVDPEIVLNARWGITDRLTWRIGTLGFGYRLGTRGRWELIPVGGILGFHLGHYPLQMRAGAGLGGRLWLTPWQTLGFHAQIERKIPIEDPDANPSSSYAHGSLSWSLDLGDRLTVTLGVGGQFAVARIPYFGRDRMLALGSTQDLGLRRTPLLQMHLSERWSLELHASGEYRFDNRYLRPPSMTPGEGAAAAKQPQWTFPILFGVGFVL